MKFFITVRAGDMAPRAYGLAWRDLPRDQSVLAPMPLNVIVRWSIEVYYWFRTGGLRGPSRADLQRELDARYRQEVY